MKRDEKELIQRSKEGDPAAFGEIVRRYQQPVYALAFHVVRDPAAAQDVAQEAFISAFTALKNLRSDDAFPSWLRRIARNKALAWRKEQECLAPLEEAAALPSQLDALGMKAETERREVDAFGAEVRRIVASLSDVLRLPLLLCYLHGVPTAEAARFLGIKEGTLRKRLHDGKKKLQERIVMMAEKTLQEYRLPRGFARQCICGCRRARQARSRERPERR